MPHESTKNSHASMRTQFQRPFTTFLLTPAGTCYLSASFGLIGRAGRDYYPFKAVVDEHGVCPLRVSVPRIASRRYFLCVLR